MIDVDESGQQHTHTHTKQHKDKKCDVLPQSGHVRTGKTLTIVWHETTCIDVNINNNDANEWRSGRLLLVDLKRK